LTDFITRRNKMVETQIVARGVHDPHAIRAMRKVPREMFMGLGTEDVAYDDGPQPIGHGQTISQPYIVALMIQAAGVRPDDTVLEIGAGSGYAAAVMAEIASSVHTVERHAPLAEDARDRLTQAGYGNIAVHVGDGTLGRPDDAPFDAIVVAAGGPNIPQALKEQLKEGGRLVIPVGEGAAGQKLLRIIRKGPQEWDQEEILAVRFVPLIGAQGWVEDDPRLDGPRAGTQSAKTDEQPLAQMIAEAAETLPEIADDNFGAFFDRYADRRVVLLGEASHGTSEFYCARGAITRRLIEHHGFNIVAVEADWPDAAAIHRYATHQERRDNDEPPFARFPTWMWRNEEVVEFSDWLRTHNAGVDAAEHAGFYGLDMYNLRGSIAAVLDYLDNVDPKAADIARERYGCLTPWQHDLATYGRAVLNNRYRECEGEVVRQLQYLLKRQQDYEEQDGESFIDAFQNARLIASAERYYRVMYYGNAESWNLRDTHMFETLENLLEARGPDAKAVVWAHNSHIGDARATDMGATRGQLNLGQLCRENLGDDAALIGFGTHRGKVAAATDWGGEMEVKSVVPSRDDSYERLCHDTKMPRFLLDLNRNQPVSRRLAKERLERYIGVIYRPETELMSHYGSASLPKQYDAWVWFDETTAITPLEQEHRTEGMPDTYPFGL